MHDGLVIFVVVFPVMGHVKNARQYGKNGDRFPQAVDPRPYWLFTLSFLVFQKVDIDESNIFINVLV